MFGLGKYVKIYKFWRKIKPLIDAIDKLYRSGELKKIVGSRKLRMVMAAQIIGTSTVVLMAWMNLPESLIQTVLTFIGGVFGAGIVGNVGEHITDTIKVVKAAKAVEAAEASTE